MANKPLLTIALLASRKKEQVIKCLDSLQVLRDALDTELIIVDTSEDPEMNQLLLTYTEKVYPFHWCNDFSKARNVSLEHASGQWYFYIDDDEWIEDVGDFIDFFQSGKYKDYGCANYVQRNYHDITYTMYSDSWVSRVIELCPDTHFESSIHEYLLPQLGDGINLHLIAGHSGYIFQTHEDRMRHFERNAPLVQKKIEEEPFNVRWYVQLLQEYEAISDWQNFLLWAEKALETFQNDGDKEFRRDVGTFYGAKVKALFLTRRYEECLKFMMTAMLDRRLQETAIAFLWIYMASCFYELGRYDKIPECVNNYFELCRELKKNKIRFENQQAALVVGSAFDEMDQKKMYALMIQAGLRFGTTEALDSYFDKMEWEKNAIYCPNGFIEALFYGMATNPAAHAFVKPMQLAWSNEPIREKLLEECEVWRRKEKQSGFNHILAILSQVQADHWFIYYAKVMCQVEPVKDHIRKMYEQIPNLLMVPDEVKPVLAQYDVPYEEYLMTFQFDQFVEMVRQFIEHRDIDHVRELEQSFMKSSYRNEFQFAYLLMRISESLVPHLRAFQEEAEVRQILATFAERTCSFYRKFFPEIMQNNPAELPEFAKAALFLERALAKEDVDPEDSKEMLHEAKTVCPAYADAIGYYQFTKFEDNSNFKRIVEMRALKKEILHQSRGLLDGGKAKDAILVLNEFHKLQKPSLESQSLKLEAINHLLKNGQSLDGLLGKEAPLLSIALMVSNRKDTVYRCVESLQPIRDAISTELIILDTGCDADLRAYLEQKADIVQSFVWCKDFAKARNETVKYASGQWYMYLDDDEWFTDTKELIDFFQSGEYLDYGYASYIQRNYLDMEGHQWTDAWVSRMAKNVPDLHFESKIHEYMMPLSGNCKGLRAVVDHYGYVFETEEALLAHTERNVSLLLEMLEEEPDNIRWYVQLVQEYRKVSDIQKLWETSLAGLNHFTELDDINVNPHVCALYAGAIYAAKEAEDYAKEIEMCVSALEDKRCSELMKAFVDLNMGEALYCQARIAEAELHKLEETVTLSDGDWDGVIAMYNNAISRIDEFLRWKDFFEDNQPLMYLQSGTAFVGECFDDVMVKKAYSIRMACELLQGDTSHFEEDFDKLEWDKEYIYIYENFMEPLLEAMCYLGRRECFLKALPVMYGHKGLWEYLVRMLTEMEASGKDVGPVVQMIKDVVPEALGLQ